MQISFKRKDAGCLICSEEKLRMESKAKTSLENTVVIPLKEKKICFPN